MTATTLLHRLDHLHGELHVNFTSSSARVGNRGHGLFVEIFRKSLVEVWENRAEERDHGVQPREAEEDHRGDREDREPREELKPERGERK